MATANGHSVSAHNSSRPGVIIVTQKDDILVDQLFATMQKEAISVRVTSANLIPHHPPIDATVVLAWFILTPGEHELSRLIDWARLAKREIAVIGCAPHGRTQDNERALFAGFDDFVSGPISPREICGRIRALTRRVHSNFRPPLKTIKFGDLVLDRAQHELWIRDRVVPMTSKEVAVLAALIESRGKVRTRSELLDIAWGDESLNVSERAVDNVVLRLRRKVGTPDFIVTLRGAGFRLDD